MTGQKLILVTGISGLIGGLVAHSLSKRYKVRGLDRRPTDWADLVQADVADMDEIMPAFQGVDTVVHMAAYMGYVDVDEQLRINVRGVFNVFEAARQTGVKRVVFASSGAAVAGYALEPPLSALAEARYKDVPDNPQLLDHLMPVRPNTLYGCAKIWGEAVGRMYSDVHGLSVICLRLGGINADDRPLNAPHAAVYLSHRDVVQLFEKSVDAPPEIAFDIFYGASDNRGRFYDLSHARNRISYEPADGIQDWPDASS